METSAPQPKPDLAFEQNDGLVTMTDRKTGFRITYPLEFKHTIKFGNGDKNTCFLNFDLSMEPFNGPYLESCGSRIYIDLHESGYDTNPEGYNRPYKTIKRDDGSNLYIIDREKSQTRVCFDFAMDGIPCEGSIDIEPALYKRYGTAIMNMLKSLTIVENPESVVSKQQPTPDITLETKDGINTLSVKQFRKSLKIPSGFEKVMSYADSKDFAIVSFDFTQPPYNEPYDFNRLENTCKSRVDICFYKGMKGKYPEFGEFAIFQFEENPPRLVIINMLKTDKTVNFDFEIPGSDCGGSVSVSRAFYDKYGASILRMLYPSCDLS